MSAGRTLGQTLRAAREAKHWDLVRAERETRIRVRYLDALERGDYRDLPNAVYSRGFVRNYATFLGLDPEQCLDLYRRETGATELPPARVTPLRPVRVGTSSAVFTTGRVVAAVVVLGVLALMAYVAYEFVTFAGTPDLTVTEPPADIAAYEGTSYVLRGETVADATITVDGLRQNPTATASASGHFTIRVELVPGSNVITLTATDPVTGRTSDPVRRTITVTLPIETPLPSGSPGTGSPGLTDAAN